MPKSGTAIRSMSLSADGNRALTLGTDGQLRVWDVRSRSLHAGFPWMPDGDEIGAAVLSADGSRLLIGSSSGMLKLWRLP
jgi:WD40 repeat protein